MPSVLSQKCLLTHIPEYSENTLFFPYQEFGELESRTPYPVFLSWLKSLFLLKYRGKSARSDNSNAVWVNLKQPVEREWGSPDFRAFAGSMV